MDQKNETGLLHRVWRFLVGQERNLRDRRLFHNLSLVAFFAWVGLGADGLSSSCYGPQEAFVALGGHHYLSIFVALASVITILVISSSYTQIIEQFPTGGGGYLVASKLLSPTVGMVSGCALIIDYVLTVTVSIASGADAVFSLLPPHLYHYRLAFAIAILIFMTVANMRGVKESVMPLVPIFLVFLLTHIFIIAYAILKHYPTFSGLALTTRTDLRSTLSQVGFVGVMFLILRSYSLGAGTYTGIEAVSNGMPELREPKVQTAKRTMTYMAVSLSFVVLGLMVAYLLYQVSMAPGKTLNAVLFEAATADWGGGWGKIFVFVALFAEATLLFVAAQTGFLGGPRVMANMAKDRWMPVRFSMLSDRLVIQNGIFLMSCLSLFLLFFSRGSVSFLVVLYSINVFITFSLSQLGMVRHWWMVRSTEKGWGRKLAINGIGLGLTAFILLSMLVFKFKEGGWLTLLITGLFVVLAFQIKKHYRETAELLKRLNTLVVAAELSDQDFMASLAKERQHEPFNPKDKTAVMLVRGFDGLGLHTLFAVLRMFGGFKNFIFVEVGVVDVGTFKGTDEINNLEKRVRQDLGRYVTFMRKNNYHADSFHTLGIDVVDAMVKLAPQIRGKYPNSVFFGGQLIFPSDTYFTRFLHNYTVLSIQRKLYREGIPFVIMPTRV
ncbi:MAG: APC family permease [Deltaproteobacteria bacterium]